MPARKPPDGACNLPESYDVAVIGAGVFGAWAAYCLRRTGRSVILLDAYGAGNSRSSSGGESRIIRMAYGADEIYTRWSMRSLPAWIALFEEAGEPSLFVRTGVLRTAQQGEPHLAATIETMRKCGAFFEQLDGQELAARFPQFHFPNPTIATLEPQSGVLLARRAVECVLRLAVRNGVDYFREAVETPVGGDVRTAAGGKIRAGRFVFACGAWLPKLFPELLHGRIVATRQEVYFFGAKPGDRRFAYPAMPAWIDFSEESSAYSVPDVDNRGFKLAFHDIGPEFEPDNESRVVEGAEQARAFLERRFPGLAGAPLLEARVCQYENTMSGDFLIDGHPERPNFLLVGGGSGHGFKHGPAVGEYVAGLLDGGVQPEPRFSLETKLRGGTREVF
jgi:sarcosine oxidase